MPTYLMVVDFKKKLLKSVHISTLFAVLFSMSQF